MSGIDNKWAVSLRMHIPETFDDLWFSNTEAVNIARFWAERL